MSQFASENLDISEQVKWDVEAAEEIRTLRRVVGVLMKEIRKLEALLERNKAEIKVKSR